MSDNRPATFGRRGTYLLLSAVVAAGAGWAGFELGRGTPAGSASAAGRNFERPAATAPAVPAPTSGEDRREGSISGAFYRHSGNPAAGGRVRLTRDGVPVASATANADGQFMFPRVPPGHYVLVGRSAWSAPGA